MLDIFFVDVLHTKIVNDKGKADRAPVVSPISWGDCALTVPGFVETFGEEFLRDYSGLWEAVHPASHFTEDIAFCVHFVTESVFIDDILWE